ncbi:membrane bound O-acyl transferase, partial [Chytriomyces sp. MP71]
DYASVLMMCSVRLSSFAWALADNPELRKSATLSDFLGYLFFMPAFFVGPAFPFSTYLKWTKELPPYNSIPSPAIPALKALFLGAFCTFLYMRFDDDWSYTHLLDPAFLARTTLLQRILFVQAAGLLMRTKYYGVWKIGEFTCILSGIGYSGADTWKACENVDIPALETSQTPNATLQNWNIFINNHLHANVYKRLRGAGLGASAANYLTKGTSAVWHGFFPGYYLTFASAAVMSMCAQMVRNEVRPLFATASAPFGFKPMYDFVSWMCAQFIMNYICGPFTVYWLGPGIAVWRAVGYA